MWKREQPEPIDLEHVMTEPPAAAAPAARPVTRPAVPSSPPSTGKCSTLGATLRFKGDLVADEDLVIQGQVEGSILHTRSVTIGAQGRMHGDIRARRIVVEGSIDGNLYAIENITIRSGATVRGDVFAPRVSVDEGARLSGRIDMDNAPAVPTVNMQLPGAPEPDTRELTEHQVDEVLTGS
jgi:cytoskeletal protein CcmA (bactofilin family)